VVRQWFFHWVGRVAVDMKTLDKLCGRVRRTGRVRPTRYASAQFQRYDTVLVPALVGLVTLTFWPLHRFTAYSYDGLPYRLYQAQTLSNAIRKNIGWAEYIGCPPNVTVEWATAHPAPRFPCHWIKAEAVAFETEAKTEALSSRPQDWGSKAVF